MLTPITPPNNTFKIRSPADITFSFIKVITSAIQQHRVPNPKIYLRKATNVNNVHRLPRFMYNVV